MVEAVKTVRIKRTPLHCTIATKQPCNIHPETGIPQLHFDQIGILTKILQEVIHDEQNIPKIEEAPPLDNAVQINKANTETLTRTKLMKSEDWTE